MTLPRIILAGTNSGSGKTTLALAVMAALRERGLLVLHGHGRGAWYGLP